MLKAALTLMSWLAMYVNGAASCITNGGLTKNSDIPDLTISSDNREWVFPWIRLSAE